MTVNIFILCFNESAVLPHAVGHYKKYLPNSNITILDNESTDDSVGIAKSLNCDVVSWKSPRFNGIDDIEYKELKNNCWKNIEYGWIIACDMDEWLCVTEEELHNEEINGTSILKVKGIDMIGESIKEDLSDIDLHGVKKYVENKYGNKKLCFLREKINEMNYGIGCHHAKPNGEVKYSSKTYYNKHMNKLGEKFLINKMLNCHKRVQEQRKYEHGPAGSQNWGIHYIDDIEQIKKNYKDALSKCKKLDNEFAF